MLRIKEIQWSKREWRFSFLLIAVYLLALLTFIPIGFIALETMPLLDQSHPIYVGLITLITCLPAAWLFARFSLVFPAMATDEPLSLKASWQLTSKQQFEITFVAVIMPSLIAALPFLIPSDNSSVSLSGTTILVKSIIESVYMAFTTVFGVVTISIAYKIICKNGITKKPKVSLSSLVTD